MSVESLVGELRGIPQRVAQQTHFNATLTCVSTKIHALQAENRSLKQRIARTAFFPDMHVIATDDSRVSACKMTLMDASPVLKAMLSAGLKEQRTSEIKTEFPAAALRTVLSTLHCPALDAYCQQPFPVLLAACRLCEEWQLPAALTSLAAKMTSTEAATAKPSLADWIAALSAAKEYTAANPLNQAWQEQAEEAAQALALAMPAAASTEGFANLDITAVCQVMRYVQNATIELPSVEVRPLALDFTKVDGRPSMDSNPFSVNGIALRLTVTKNASEVDILVDAIQKPRKHPFNASS